MKKIALVVPLAAAAIALAACGTTATLDSSAVESSAPSTATSQPCLADSSLEAGTPACQEAAAEAEAPTTTTPPPPDPQKVRGSGDDVVDIESQTHAQTVTFECPSCTGNVILQSDGPKALLVNTIGAYSGTRLINMRDNSMTSQITVKASGSWTLTLKPIESLEQQDGKVSGHGDDVVLMTSHGDRAEITNAHGDSNFIVTDIGLDSGMLSPLVNEIGGYSGTVPMELPGLVEVQSNGDWTITPE